MRRLSLALALAAALASPLALLTAAPAPLQRQRIVAIGDVHGAATSFAAILQRAGLIDEGRRWTGGNAILVQTGDMTDRGAGMRDALDLLMALETEAPKSRGRVHALLGNHEVMNMLGQMRDATPEIFATFGGEAEMRQAFGPDGHYGRWLRRKPALQEIDDTVFMHAGLNPEYSEASLDEVNRRVRDEIEAWDAGVRLLVRLELVSPAPAFVTAIEAARAEIQRLNALHAQGKTPEGAAQTATALLPVANIVSSSLFHADGPLWFRGFSNWSDAEGEARVAALLARHRVHRFVTGHSVQAEGRIRERFDGRLFLIDTGMLGGKYFPGGQPSALEFTPTAIRQIYLQ
jgi:hypothetical protein